MSIEAFIIVHTGGDYSDFYHNNLAVFLTREEAEQYIERQRKLYALFSPYCTGSAGFDFRAICDEWDKINGKPDIVHIPKGQATNKNIVNQAKNKRFMQRDAWVKEEILSRCHAKLSDPDCELSNWQQVELIRNCYVNPYDAMEDAEIEDIKIIEGTVLWRILSEQQEKEKSE